MIYIVFPCSQNPKNSMKNSSKIIFDTNESMDFMNQFCFLTGLLLIFYHDFFLLTKPMLVFDAYACPGISFIIAIV